MSYEISINGETQPIQILNRDGNKITVQMGDRTYELDVFEREPGIYVVLRDGKTYNFELKAYEPKKYKVNTFSEILDVEIIDPESRYSKNRKGSQDDDADHISTPMPGQVVKVLVEEGQEVKAGETVVVVSAMKMESEYKVTTDRVVQKVLVKEGDKIDSNQPLVIFEALE